MIPAAHVPSVTIKGQSVRLYQHPTVPNGRPWCALHDMALVAGYAANEAQETTAAFAAAYPKFSETGEDGAMAVSDTAAIGFLTFLDMMGVSTAQALYESYAAETNKAWLTMTAHLPRPEWEKALQRSTLADALPDIDRAAN